MRTKVLAAALSGGLVLSAGIAAAFPGVSYADPAPPANADAVAVRLDPIIKLSHTHATADATGGEAKANVLEISGNGISGFGGSTKSGSAKGALFDTNPSALGQLQIAPWNASSTSTATSRHAESYAALLSLVLVNDRTLFVKVLQSSSTADHDDTTLKSTGRSVSDGAIIGVGNTFFLDLLHAEASSDGGGSTYLVGITSGSSNVQLVTPAQSSACTFNVAPLLSLVCLKVDGGKGTNNAASDLVATVNNGSLVGGISNVSSTTGSGTAVQANTVQNPNPAPAPAPAPAPVVAGNQLPRTGAASMALAALGVMLLLFGFAAVAVTRMRKALPIAG